MVGRRRLYGISPFEGEPGVFEVHWEVGRIPR